MVVVGAGQAGLSAAFHLQRLTARDGLPRPGGSVVLDHNPDPGGAWQHRWPTLTVADVHGIYRLPGLPGDRDTTVDLPADEPASVAVPAYFAAYEARHGIDVRRPVVVRRVQDSVGTDEPLLDVVTDQGTWRTRTLVNATGTWTKPFVPSYPGLRSFRGRSLHTAEYRGPEPFAGRHVLVVGGGASAVQLLAEISGVAETTWVTRRPPRWRTEDRFSPEIGRAAVALVDQRVRSGLVPESVVSVTGLRLRPQEAEAAARGVYDRRPMFAGSSRTVCAGPTAATNTSTSSSGAPDSARRSTIWRHCTFANPAAGSGWTGRRSCATRASSSSGTARQRARSARTGRVVRRRRTWLGCSALRPSNVGRPDRQVGRRRRGSIRVGGIGGAGMRSPA